VHKPIYASGFLYHLATQQILLQQAHLGDDSITPWTMFGGKNQEGEDAATTFQRIIREETHIDLEAKNILPVYDYIRDIHDTIHYILYAEVPTLYMFPPNKEKAFSWFTYKLTNKLHFEDQTRQDIIVSERVIKAVARSHEPEIILPHNHRQPDLFR
jgi:ADP-ribose pyrophosphatase YjhB (NUDIX family)